MLGKRGGTILIQVTTLYRRGYVVPSQHFVPFTPMNGQPMASSIEIYLPALLAACLPSLPETMVMAIAWCAVSAWLVTRRTLRRMLMLPVQFTLFLLNALERAFACS